MIWFRLSKKEEELAKLLKKSSRDFGFDRTGVRYRLLTSIRINDQTSASKPTHRVLSYSLSLASFTVLIVATFAFASNAKPGDKLFSINKFGENLVLGLPMPVEQKARVQEYIVTNRLEELDEIEPAKNLEILKETDERLTQAVNTITENKQKMEAMGKTEKAEKLEHVLDVLENNMAQKEAKLKEIEEKTKDQSTKVEIQKHIKKIQESRKKARLEIKRFQTSEDETENHNPGNAPDSSSN